MRKKMKNLRIKIDKSAKYKEKMRNGKENTHYLFENYN